MSWVPGWDSIEGADRWHNIFFWIGIALLVLLAAAETLSQIYSWRKDALAAKADGDRAGQQQQADARRDQALTAAQDAARKANDELTELKAPRHLEPPQKQKLAEFLSAQPKGSLTIKANVAAKDGRAFADEIAEFLRKTCGWNVRVDNAMIAGPDTTGLWFAIKDREHVPPETAAIHNGFENAGIAVRHAVEIDPGIPSADEIWLSVGLKP